MSLWKYKYFVDVVELKSFTKAGKKNYVSQTAVSQQIADLEKKMGGKLLYRESGMLELTELGGIVYKRAKEILTINSQLEKEVEQFQENYVIRIGIDSSINKKVWRKMQEMIDRYYSEEDFKFSRVDGSVGSRMLDEHSIDIYIGYGIEEKYRSDDIEETRLCEGRLGVYTGEDSMIKASGVITLDELKGHRRYATKMYPCSMIKMEDKKFRDNCGDIRCVDNTETMKIKVEFNNGYAFVDSRYFSQCSGQIHVLVDVECPQKIKAYYKKNRKKNKTGEVLTRIAHIMRE